jgi:hypothetical protein
MANPEHLAILMQGSRAWNEWRKEASNTTIIPDLKGAELQDSDLREFNLVLAQIDDAHLERADFRFSDLRSASLVRTVAINANFNGSDLGGARFEAADLRSTQLFQATMLGADLSGADLREALLIQTVLDSAILTGANLTQAHLNGAILTGIDFSETVGLEDCLHIGPCAIDFRSFLRSRGPIPRKFLRGCGVPEPFIVNLGALVNALQAIQFFSCFLSYSKKDGTFCDRFYSSLVMRNLSVWRFEEDAKWGESVWGEIDQGIQIYDKVIVICSEHSLQSGPVLREIERALQREDREHKDILLPVRLDDYVFGPWEHPRKADLLSKVVGDFDGWDRDSDKYDIALERLIEALQAPETKRP